MYTINTQSIHTFDLYSKEEKPRKEKMDYLGHGWGMGFGMWFIPILLVVVVFYFLKENNKGKEETFSAQDILDKRYANGEINTQEYEEKSNTLKKNN